VDAFWLSLVVIFVAELGDKSQLMALAFAARYKALPVLIAITIATAVVHAFSVLVGGLLGSAFPSEAVSVAAGLAFFGFAFWTLRGDDLDERDQQRARRWHRSPILAVGVAFFLAELGDKTMLATVTLATTEGWLGTWIGSTVGMVAADALAILAGRELGARVPERTIRIGAASGFVVFGVWLVVDGLVG
jgi:Ca2+/H+ antiporter, TMEM165/GDT1 family